MDKNLQKNEKFYIAYGSNLSLEQMQFRCPDAKPIGIGVLKNYELLFRGEENFAVATVELKNGVDVPVGIWKITPKDEKALDRYEGYPRLYRKEFLEVEIGKKRIEAMVYIMNPGRPIGKPNRFYYQTILQGYRNFRLDEKFLNSSVKRCTKKSKNTQR